MPQLDSQQGGSDASVNSSPGMETGSHARQDAGFSHVGDTSTNAAWSEMTGGRVGGSDLSACGGHSGGGSPVSGSSDAGKAGDGAGGGDAGRNQSIDFSQHGDIYASTAGMAPPSDSSSGGFTRSMDGGSNGKADGSAGDGKSGYGSDFHQDYDPKTSTLDGSNFYNLSDSQLRTMSEGQLDSVNSNNVANMEGRVADLGDKMPNVMFRGAGGEFAGEMDSLAAGQSTGSEGGRHYAMSKEFSSDPATQLSDLAANMQKGKSYAESSGGNLYAFEMKDPGMMNGARSREAQNFAPAPFADSNNAGENVIKATPGNTGHIATFHHSELQHENRNTPLPEGMSMDHAAKLDTHLQARNVDKVLTQIESQHADFLRQQQADRAQSAAEAAAQQGIWSRLSQSVKGLF